MGVHGVRLKMFIATRVLALFQRDEMIPRLQAHVCKCERITTTSPTPLASHTAPSSPITTSCDWNVCPGSMLTIMKAYTEGREPRLVVWGIRLHSDRISC